MWEYTEMVEQWPAAEWASQNALIAEIALGKEIFSYPWPHSFPLQVSASLW